MRLEPPPGTLSFDPYCSLESKKQKNYLPRPERQCIRRSGPFPRWGSWCRR